MTRQEVRELLRGAVTGDPVGVDDGESVPGMRAAGNPGWRLVGLGPHRGETLWSHRRHGLMIRRLRFAAAEPGSLGVHLVTTAGSADYIPVEVAS